MKTAAPLVLLFNGIESYIRWSSAFRLLKHHSRHEGLSIPLCPASSVLNTCCSSPALFPYSLSRPMSAQVVPHSLKRKLRQGWFQTESRLLLLADAPIGWTFTAFFINQLAHRTCRTVSSCTSYQGILSGTVDGVITLKNAAGVSSLIITGGTEVGHAGGANSHANGFKVDVRHQTGLDSYIKNTFTKIANRSDGFPQWQAASGNLYCVRNMSITHLLKC